MVVGKLFILLATNTAYSDTFESPRFFEYSNGSALTRAVAISFGWFKTLDEETESAYRQSIVHAFEYAENGEKVRWYKNNASGSATPVATWPNTSGYCRRVHIEAIAYGIQKVKGVTGCYDNTLSKWTWYADK